MSRGIWFLSWLIVVVLSAVVPAKAETRAALVIGNSAYAHAEPLANPVRDANLIADTLETLGFTVVRAQDLTRDGFAKTLSAFLRDQQGADVTVVYFAGHGMQYEDRNYLLGVDARLATAFDVEAEAIDLDKLVRSVRASTRAALIFVDACRDNPLAEAFYRREFSATRAVGTRGLTIASNATQGAMTVYSASPGEVAFDGVDAPNSPFATALAKHLPTGNLEVLTLMKRVIRDVQMATDNQQTPVVTNDLTAEIYLALEEGAAAETILVAQEKAMFDAAAAIRSVRAWDLFLARYPAGQLAGMAKAEREEVIAADLAAAGDAPDEAATREVAAEAERILGITDVEARAVQAALNALGYDAGPEDGVIGGRTRKAVADFQAATGLPSTGIITAETAGKLGVTLGGAGETGGMIVASRDARRYDPDQLALVETDPRLITAARSLAGKEFVYGFYEGRLYLAVLNWCCADWTQANGIATAAGGHLATITSDAENDFVVRLIRHDDRFWEQVGEDWINGPMFGLRQAENAREPGGGWAWVTGEPAGFLPWYPGQPNNNEGSASFGGFGHLPPSQTGGRRDWGAWDDYVRMNRSFVIEVE